MRQLSLGPTTLTVRAFVVDRPVGVYLHVHGGGWVTGAADQQDARLAKTAAEGNVIVLSLDYRLAPEHPHPAARDDCVSAARWLLEHAESEWGVGSLLIGGESAGAHLAALALLELRRERGTTGFNGALLSYGVYDLGMTPSQRRSRGPGLVLSREDLEWFYSCYVPGLSPDRRRHPTVSPLYADLSGLPQALFLVGTSDILCDDTVFMAARWEVASSNATLLLLPESPHGVLSHPTRISEAAASEQTAYIRSACGRAAPS
jgi:acetyl esterase/lipase